MLRSTTQPNHPTVKTLSFESLLESSLLPRCLDMLSVMKKLSMVMYSWRKQEDSAISSMLLDGCMSFFGQSLDRN